MALRGFSTARVLGNILWIDLAIGNGRSAFRNTPKPQYLECLECPFLSLALQIIECRSIDRQRPLFILLLHQIAKDRCFSIVRLDIRILLGNWNSERPFIFSRLLLVNLGFFMCPIYCPEIEQLSVSHTEKMFLDFRRLS